MLVPAYATTIHKSQGSESRRDNPSAGRAEESRRDRGAQHLGPTPLVKAEGVAEFRPVALTADQ
jgi:hypothetical protein